VVLAARNGKGEEERRARGWLSRERRAGFMVEGELICRPGSRRDLSRC
jgi:hypothetical protein